MPLSQALLVIHYSIIPMLHPRGGEDVGGGGGGGGGGGNNATCITDKALKRNGLTII